MTTLRAATLLLLLSLHHLAAFSSPQPAPTPEPTPTPTPPPPEVTSRSLLRVNCTNQTHNFFNPWLKKTPFARRGLGTVIEGGRILVTAELVANATFIELEKAPGGEKSSATVETIDHSCNLATLRANDPFFIKDMVPVPLATQPALDDTVDVLQLEPNGDVARTPAQVTTITIGPYPMDNLGLLLYRIRVPLQQREGSYTVPAVRDGRLAGLLMRYNASSQSADVASMPVIRRFLSHPGTPRVGITFAPLRDPQLRRYLGLEKPGGIYISEVVPHSSAAAAGLREGDVILAIDDQPLDHDGHYLDPSFGRILFSHLTNTATPHGSAITFTILRDGEQLDIPVTMLPPAPTLMVSESLIADRPPPYLVLGGLVFVELSRPYLMEWGPDWQNAAPRRLVHYDAFQNELPPERRKIIVLAQVIPTPDTIGYENLSNLVVTSLNNRPIHTLHDLAAAAESPVDGFHRIEFEEDPKLIFLDAASVADHADDLARQYNLPSLQRLDTAAKPTATPTTP
jgi:hypothetical protein